MHNTMAGPSPIGPHSSPAKSNWTILLPPLEQRANACKAGFGSTPSYLTTTLVFPRHAWEDGRAVWCLSILLATLFPVMPPESFPDCSSTMSVIIHWIGSGRSLPPSRSFAGKHGCRTPVAVVNGERRILEAAGARPFFSQETQPPLTRSARWRRDER